MSFCVSASGPHATAMSCPFLPTNVVLTRSAAASHESVGSPSVIRKHSGL